MFKVEEYAVEVRQISLMFAPPPPGPPCGHLPNVLMGLRAVLLKVMLVRSGDPTTAPLGPLFQGLRVLLKVKDGNDVLGEVVIVLDWELLDGEVMWFRIEDEVSHFQDSRSFFRNLPFKQFSMTPFGILTGKKNVLYYHVWEIKQYYLYSIFVRCVSDVWC